MPDDSRPRTTLRVNGSAVTVHAEPSTVLLYVLRNDLGLKGTRFGCGTGLCGACTVLVDGAPVQSCDLPLSAVGERSVDTVESLSRGGALHPIQQAILDVQAGQCGYCLSGIMMSAVALLRTTSHPDRATIRDALSGNLCRCGVHDRIIRAVERASDVLSGEAG